MAVLIFRGFVVKLGGDVFLVSRIRKRVVVLSAIWIIMLLGTLLLLSQFNLHLSANPDAHVIVSLGWAGYIVSKTFNDQQLITSISASWIVPKLDASAGDGYSSAWIGIGGQLDKTLIQIGTEHNVYNGKESYGAWYEMLPDYSIRIDGFKLAPGNQVTASITLVDADAHLWNLWLYESTSGQVFNRNFVYDSTGSSGEWIVERSTVNGQISTLSNFQAVTFNDCQIGVGSDCGVIANFTYSRVHMATQIYTMLASTTKLASSGCSFTVTYDAL